MLLVQSVPTEIRELDLDAFRLDLKDIEDNVDGITFSDSDGSCTIFLIFFALKVIVWFSSILNFKILSTS